MFKRTEAELEDYLARKVGKHLNSLTGEQVIALRKQIAERKLKALHHVKDQFNKLAEVNDRDREVAAQRMVQSAVDQVVHERQGRVEATVADSRVAIEAIKMIADAIETLAGLKFMDESNSSALTLEHVANIRSEGNDVHAGHVREIRRILDEELPRYLGRNQGEVTFALDRVDDKVEELAHVYYRVGVEANAATAEVADAFRNRDAAAVAPGEQGADPETRAIMAACDRALTPAGSAGGAAAGLSEAFRSFRRLKTILLDSDVEAQINKRLEQRKAAQRHRVDGAPPTDGGSSTKQQDQGQGPEEPGSAKPGKDARSGKKKVAEEAEAAARARAIDPVFLARRACQQHIQHLDQALGAIALVVDDVAPAGVAYLIHDLLLDAGSRHFKQRILLAVDKLDAGLESYAADEKTMPERMERDAWFVMADYLGASSPLVATLTEALDGITGDRVGAKLMAKIREIVSRRLIRYLPPRPRQQVNANKIRADVSAILNRATVAPIGDPAFEHQQPDRPVADIAGVAVRRYLMDWIERDADGGYYWVEMAEGAAGKLYVEGTRKGQFTAVPGAEARMPRSLADGTRIDSVVSAAPTGMADYAWSVRIKDLIGYVDAAATRFSPSRPSRIDDWSSRRIIATGYVEGAKEVAGRWTRVPNRDGTFEFYLFVDENGERRWAAADSRAANTEATAIKIFAATKLDIVKIDEVGFTSAPALRA